MTDNFDKPYEYNPREVRDDTKLNEQTALILEGYAMALTSIMWRLTGDTPCNKGYDPLSVENETTAWSYAFSMKDGGREHDLTDYKDVGEMMDVLLSEALEWIQEDETI